MVVCQITSLNTDAVQGEGRICGGPTDAIHSEPEAGHAASSQQSEKEPTMRWAAERQTALYQPSLRKAQARVPRDHEVIKDLDIDEG